VVNLEGLASSTVHTRLDAIGWGPYQLLLMMIIGFAMLTESLEMGALAPIHTALAHNFGFSDAARSALPAMVFAGSGFGLAIAAPLSDRYGRKLALQMSLAMIALVMCSTASLPSTASVHVILTLRFLAGAAAAMPIPAGFALAVESCPRENRASLVFGISFLGSVGYLLAAIGVKVFMPHFGEVSTDSWRAFCFFTAVISVVSVPLITLLQESPCFLAVKGDAENCVFVLDAIAVKNEQSLLGSFALPEMAHQSPPCNGESWYDQMVNSTSALLSSHLRIFVLLAIIDSCRTFFVSGSSYLWKDLLYQVSDDNESSYLNASSLNIVASISPLIGLVLAERFVYLGVRRVTFFTALVATLSLVALMRTGIRSSPLSLLVCIMLTKVTYGPLGTCIILIKVEAFPTVVRVSAFSMISIVSKLACAFAPTLVELLKSGETADSWTEDGLSAYLTLLAFCALTSGVMALTVPGSGGDGTPLNDYAGEKVSAPHRVQMLACQSYGSLGSSFETASSGISSDEGLSPESRPHADKSSSAGSTAR